MIHLYLSLINPLAAVALTLTAHRAINTWYLVALLLLAITGQLLAIRNVQKPLT